MGRGGEYPEWVTKYLEKGVYVNKVKGTYYLYRAHSEKQPGKKYPVRVFDGYIGKVTEDEGLIEIRRRKLPMTSFDYALPYAVDACCGKVHKGLRISYKGNGTAVYVCSVIKFLFGSYSMELYQSSWLSIQYPGLVGKSFTSEAVAKGVDRGVLMVTDTVKNTYGEDWEVLSVYLSRVILIRIGGEEYIPTLPEKALELCQKHHLDFPST